MWKIIFVKCCSVGGQQGVHRDPNAIAMWQACISHETTASGYSAFSRCAKTDFRVHRDPP